MGGPSGVQKQAQKQQLQNSQQEGALANSSAGKFNDLYGQTQPFYANEEKNGLPFLNNLTDYNSGTIAQAYAPAKAAALRATQGVGALPSGFRAGTLNDVNENQAHAFDSTLMNTLFQNQAAKQQGAAGLSGLMQTVNPAAFYGGSSSAAGGAAQPLQAQQNPWLGVLGGSLAGASSALPF